MWYFAQLILPQTHAKYQKFRYMPIYQITEISYRKYWNFGNYSYFWKQLFLSNTLLAWFSRFIYQKFNSKWSSITSIKFTKSSTFYGKWDKVEFLRKYLTVFFGALDLAELNVKALKSSNQKTGNISRSSSTW